MRKIILAQPKNKQTNKQKILKFKEKDPKNEI